MSSRSFFSIGIATLVVAIVVVAVLIYRALAPEPPVIEEVTVEEEVAEEIFEPVTSNSVIGQSVEGRNIETYTFGSGEITLLLVGGIHGGYEWNSSVLAWEMIDHLSTNPTEVPPNVTVHIIPTLNPDGLALVTNETGSFTAADVFEPGVRNSDGRFNANEVDLNRNFDCNWNPTSTWRSAVISAGTAPFSEPEAAALRTYVETIKPAAALFWHSQANNVYGSSCNGEVLPATIELGQAYATAGSYGWVELFDAYPITGDVEGWLASIGIPAVTVELESFRSSEWERNWAGVQSWFEYFSDSDLLSV